MTEYAAGIINVITGTVIETLAASNAASAATEAEYLTQYRQLRQHPNLTATVLTRESAKEPWRIGDNSAPAEGAGPTDTGLSRLLVEAGGPHVPAPILLAFLTAVEEAGNPLLPVPRKLPVTRADGTAVYPGDNRFAIRVRTATYTYTEQVIEASDFTDLFAKADALPLDAWFPEEDDTDA